MHHWENKTVIIAGGSKGLGLAIAKAFHRLGGHVVMLARNQDKLSTEVAALEHIRSGSAVGIAVDLLDKAGISEAVSQTAQRRGGVDVWVNAVGQSTRVEFSQASLELYRQLMEQNFFSAVNGTYAVLDYLARSNGHLVNIGSLASRTAWPWVAPYVTSKHALSGFTDQLRLEGPANVHYLFVCPGPIASDSNSQRYEVSGQMTDQASRPGAGAPVKLIDPGWLANRIVDACEKRKPELVVPVKSRMLFGLRQLWPSLGLALLKRLTAKK